MASYVHLVSVFTNAVSGNCQHLNGFWYNQLGTEIQLQHTRNGTITGKYVQERNSKEMFFPIVGAAPYEGKGTTFGFSVTEKNGLITTAWTGQCMMGNDGNETLHTTWLMREYVHSSLNKWRSSRIGQDVFTRLKPGSRIYNTIDTNVAQPTVAPTQVTTNLPSCNLAGTWYNDVGTEMILNHNEDNLLTGEYRTAVERNQGAAGTTHSVVYGTGVKDNPNTTVAFFVVWRGGRSTTGWVGQCYLSKETNTEVLETIWILRVHIDDYEDEWKAVHFGSNTFTRHEQKSGPRKADNIHTPIDDGEDNEQDTLEYSACGTQQNTPMSLVYVLVLLCFKL